ncbi:MAG: hypothetical protein NC312_10820 [Bacteroides fragilis]|nr:hypothetical protein [Bacteroides fragilis]
MADKDMVNEDMIKEELAKEESVEEEMEKEESAEEELAKEESAEEEMAEDISEGGTDGTKEENGMEDALEEAASAEELNRLKAWLFKENVRLISAAKELEQTQEQFREEKEQFQEEMKSLNRKMAAERQRLKEDNLFFEKKMEILKSGFTELDMDRRRLEKEWAKLEAQKEVLQQPAYSGGRDVSDLFRGVKNPLALKKRYKDLIKIFHPDNVAGDKEMIQKINIEYETLKHDFDIGKWA